MTGWFLLGGLGAGLWAFLALADWRARRHVARMRRRNVEMRYDGDFPVPGVGYRPVYSAVTETDEVVPAATEGVPAEGDA